MCVSITLYTLYNDSFIIMYIIYNLKPKQNNYLIEEVDAICNVSFNVVYNY